MNKKLFCKPSMESQLSFFCTRQKETKIYVENNNLTINVDNNMQEQQRLLLLVHLTDSMTIVAVAIVVLLMVICSKHQRFDCQSIVNVREQKGLSPSQFIHTCCQK